MGAPQLKTLTTGTNDIIAELGLIRSPGIAVYVAITITNTSENALTNIGMNVRNDESFPWESYLTGTDWEAETIPLQRTWSSSTIGAPAFTLAAGATVILNVLTTALGQMQLTASGTAGSVLRVLVTPIYDSNLKV